MGQRRSLRDRVGIVLEGWVKHLACFGWTPPPDPDVSAADAAPPDLDEQLQDLFRVVRRQEVIWKSDDLLKRTLRQGSRRPRPKRGNGS